jgi:acyl-CoA synthetase (NDP forming)
MLQARSVAIVGASGRAGSVGEQALRQLRNGGFDGEIYPVNPGYDSLLGLTCHPDISSLGRPVDLAVLAVSNTHLEAETEKALAAGARSLAIFASCHGLAADGITPLRQRITELANQAGAPICGGNGMGFVNVEDRLRVCGFYQPDLLVPGGITFLSHSGSLFSALLHNRRGLAFNLVVSTGLELNTRMSDYFAWALDQESTKVVALFMETIRDPAGFSKALAIAADRETPVVALKVGASTRGRAAVATHSEAIAGDDAVYEALFDAHGVHRVLTMDEMADTMELMSTSRRPVPGGLGAVHDSGGERALLIDTADRVGVPIPDLGPATVNTLTGLLDPGLEPANPVDAWGTGRDATAVFIGCLNALATDPAIGVVAFSVDLTAEENMEEAYGMAALEAAAHTDKPIVVLAHVATTVDQMQAEVVRSGGVPVLQGTETGLRAIGHLIARADRLRWPEPEARLTEPASFDVIEITELLEHYGIPVARTVTVDRLEDLLGAAGRLGYPVVLKTGSSDHKTDVDGVVLGIADQGSLSSAYVDMTARLGPSVTVSEQIAPGVEIGLGMVTDPQFGPVVLVSAGGTLIELLRDRVALLPPVDDFRAGRAIARLAVDDVLRGVRGAGPVSLQSLLNAVVRFSELAADAHGIYSSIDLNPVIVGEDTAVVVDVLAVPV